MKKILVVEDEPGYSHLLNDQLTVRGYKIILAENGEKGLELAKKENPDLILLDIMMPKMDGTAMLDLLRKDKAGKKMKVIMLTNLEVDDKIISHIVDDQPAYYFIKSDTKFDDLMKKIETMTAN